MDFFEAQARAKKHTSRLVVLFTLAIVCTVAASYVGTVFALRQTNDYHPRRTSHNSYQVHSEAGPLPSWWQPRLLLGVSMAVLAVIGLASIYKWSEFSAGGSAVAESVCGRRVDPHTIDTHERRLLNVVEEMAIASGVPVPAVYILDEEPGINAFAAGLTTSDAVVAVTRGTLEKLSRDELQGVVGHEFSHILNGDMRLNLRLTALVFGILFLGLAGRGILWSLRYQSFGGSRDRDGKNSGGIVVAIAFVGLVLLVVGYVGYFFGRLIQAAVSRQREYLADASAVQFTRNPGGLTGALKKIGGFALGSSMQSNKSAAIGHFFFAQGFRSSFGGLWATHPPLDERIRAIDPQFDGQMFEPPEVVDVAHESFVTAGLAPARPAAVPPILPSAPSPSSEIRSSTAAAAVAAVGLLTPEQIENSQLLLDSTPARLRRATQTPAEAQVLLYALLLDDDPSIRARQRDFVAGRAGGDALHLLHEFEPSLSALRPEHRLPLLQLALPALRQLPPSALGPFLDTLDELIHADGRVTAFEFALQKLLIRTLALGRSPASATTRYFSFNAVIPEIALVLSVVAHASDNGEAAAAATFAAGAAQLKLIESQLTFLDKSAYDLAKFDAALDKLAGASLPIRQRTVVAAAHVVGADGQILVPEAELLRAIAATLDVPMPPLILAA
ncbi:MAG: M48 family metallopeptidase [Verrucomicrobia bacterium]|nr:M48 family metallopeptidase [Verrucomicrobiota bacterium]